MVSSTGFTRRNFLTVATTAVGAAGLGIAAWPLLDQMNPDASTVAAGDFVDIELSSLQAGHPAIRSWHFLPITIVKRTPEALKILQEPKRVARLVDPSSDEDQQPAYAKNWHRSLHPEWAVLVGVCTYCRCVPQYFPEDLSFDSDRVGEHVCPCCASKYDLAGRVYLGAIARHNLPVPPHSFVDENTLRVGKNPPGEIFFFESIKSV